MQAPGYERESFQHLLQRYRDGDAEAGQTLYRQYSDHIRRAVRAKLHQRMRTIFDSGDFLQSVWASFFMLPDENYQFETAEDMVKFLCCIAHNKVVEAHRAQARTIKRDLFRTQLITSDDAERDAGIAGLPGLDATPSQHAVADEIWERLQRVYAGRHRELLELLREGHTRKVVAARLGLSEMAVARILTRLEALIPS